MRIPTELRLQIYSTAITTHWEVYPRIYSGFVDGSPEPPLLRVCRSFRSEGLNLYIDFLKAQEAAHLDAMERITAVMNAAENNEEAGDETCWLTMNRLWIERDMLPSVQSELKRVEHFGPIFEETGRAATA